MNVRLTALGVWLLALVTPAVAHRVDEYLQATIISVGKDQLKADVYLTPGVTVSPTVLANIDRDGDGVLSDAEQRAYAERVLEDLSLTLNRDPVRPQLVAIKFPAIDDLQEGRGDIHLEFTAPLLAMESPRVLRLENHHASAISAYQVNCLIPDDPSIRIGAEHRDYSQSVYELNYTQTGVRPSLSRFAAASAVDTWVGTVAILLCIWLALQWRQQGQPPSAERSFS